MSTSPLIDTAPLAMHWQTLDPFLFCAHHDDAYPPGTEDLGPQASLAGRSIGQDFSGKDGWSMYHGDRVPGFPQHPHRGFETVTVVRKGLIDHADSMSASARFGEGDLQWMTAGRGIVHSEMFPLVHKDQDNPTELFQIWLNLPARSKMVESYFSMFWRQKIPSVTCKDSEGRKTTLVSYCGAIPSAIAPHAAQPLAPPPDSWAADPDNKVVIWTLKMAPGATWTLPQSDPGCNRRLYFFKGDTVETCGQSIDAGTAMTLQADADIELKNGPREAEFLLLEGRPVGEPVAQYGPFVMNTTEEIHQAMADYQKTGFGGWPWPDDAPTHAGNAEPFARYPDGRKELQKDG